MVIAFVPPKRSKSYSSPRFFLVWAHHWSLPFPSSRSHSHLPGENKKNQTSKICASFYIPETTSGDGILLWARSGGTAAAGQLIDKLLSHLVSVPCSSQNTDFNIFDVKHIQYF